jgi:DNA-binding transcriptional LysR family regulator
LRLVETLGRLLSVTQCAEALHTSQSAVSRGLAEIEELLGQRLFERTTRSITPTAFGQNLIWHAGQILSQLDRAEADFDALGKGIGSSIAIGVQGGCSPLLIGRAVSLMQQHASKVAVHIGSNFSDGLMPELINGRYNLIVTHFDVREFSNNDLAIDILYQETVSVLAAPGHPLVRRKKIGWPELAEERWVMTPALTSTRRIVDRNLLVHARANSPIIAETMHVQYLMELVRSDGMLTALPSYLGKWFEHELGLVRALDVKDAGASWSVCAARVRSRRLSPSETLFLNCLKSASAELFMKEG